ncbi:OmpA family protein, partial [Vibrio paucivorans]
LKSDFFQADELAGYHVDSGRRYKIGYTSQNNPRIWNSTSLLDTHADISVVEAAFGSSNELIFESDAQSPRIYFYIPQSGRLRITRPDGTPVLERNVSAGQNFVTHDELPVGISTLHFEVSAGQQVLYQEVHKIYNNSDQTLDVGDWDYHFAAGIIYGQEVVFNEFYLGFSVRLNPEPSPTATNTSLNQAPVMELETSLPEPKPELLDVASFAFNTAVTPVTSAMSDLRLRMQEDVNCRVVLTGHTDSLGNDDINQRYSEKRATFVESYLIEGGISPSRISTNGAGARVPVADNATEVGRAANRRVEAELKCNINDSDVRGKK